MFGIYSFKNKINNKRYIGQSKNLEERYKAHLRNYTNENLQTYNGHFYRALRKYGIENFEYEILYSDNFIDSITLNELEIYYIKFYDSFNNGYNMNLGGQYTSGPKTLNQDQVDEIVSILQSNEQISFIKISEQYNVSDGTIRLINLGTIWKKSNIEYPIRKNTYIHNIGGSNPNAKLTDEFVLFLRQEFVTKDLSQLSKEYSDIPFSSLKKAVYGVQFKHLPVYKKRKNKWFLNDTCIDYPRLEE